MKNIVPRIGTSASNNTGNFGGPVPRLNGAPNPQMVDATLDLDFDKN